LTEKIVNRIEWIDVLKLLGIIAVFAGHLGNEELASFVFKYHVPLFFFVSGLFANRNNGLSYKVFLKKKTVTIIFPYIFFCIISELVLIVTSRDSLITYIKYVKQFVFAVRNHMPVVQLWFFTCLFVQVAVFELIRRVVKDNKIILLSISMGLYFIFSFAGTEPKLFWNIDSAMYYMIWYCLGYIISDNVLKISIQPIYPIMLLVITILIFWFLTQEYSTVAMALIGLNILVAYIIGKLPIPFVKAWGKDTLWLCGNEWLIKQIYFYIFGILKIEKVISTPAIGIIFALAMIIGIYYVLMPLEKKVYFGGQKIMLNKIKK